MAEHNGGHDRQKFAAVAPLILVIAASLIWSGYATYHHAIDAMGPSGTEKLPGLVAWTLIAALDGTVVVTTPVWLSTVLPAKVRNYAAVICMGALGGSMYINYLETGVDGVFPPLIAGALIHLVGVVLRAFARIEKDSAKESAKKSAKESPAVDAESAPVHAPVSVALDAPQIPAEPREVPPTLAPPVPPAPVLADLDRSADEPAETPAVLDRDAPASPMDTVRQILGSAYAKGEALPGGAVLTAAVREAGFEVNDNYGRSARARWMEKHPMAREEVAA